MGAPKYKLYSEDRGYTGALKEPIDCARLMMNTPEAVNVRLGHRQMDIIFDDNQHIYKLDELEAWILHGETNYICPKGHPPPKSYPF